MDGSSFDRIVRALGAASTRRGAVAALAGLALATSAPVPGLARRRCRKDSPAGQCCKKDGTCTCTDGGTVCGTNCCHVGQTCVDGICSAMPEPPICLTYGQPCKNAGVPCCEGMTCGSGQGGGHVACWVQKTGRCDSTSECIYGTACVDGICAGVPQPTPNPGPVCVELAGLCSPSGSCCAGSCGRVSPVSDPSEVERRCCVAVGQPCQQNPRQCCCSGIGSELLSYCDGGGLCACGD